MTMMMYMVGENVRFFVKVVRNKKTTKITRPFGGREADSPIMTCRTGKLYR
jgi:hypothetical protein